MFNFSANNLVWIATKSYQRYAVHQFMDSDTKRHYWIFDFKKLHIFQTETLYCASGKVNSADKLYLVIEKMKPKK
jgi:hypothetical protein